MTDARGEVLWLTRICRVIALFPLVLGASIALTGSAGFEVLFGVELGEVSSTLESGIRFLATSFFGMGLVLIWATRDVVARSGALQIFFGTMIFGAFARLVGIAAHGTPNLVSLVLIGIELTGAPMWLWHRSLLRRRQKAVL